MQLLPKAVRDVIFWLWSRNEINADLAASDTVLVKDASDGAVKTALLSRVADYAKSPFAEGFPSYGKIASEFGVERFLMASSAYTFLARGVSGTGAAISSAGLQRAGRPGGAKLQSGTDTTGNCYVISGATSALFGGGAWRLRWDVWIPDASDGTDTFVARWGFIDTVSGDSQEGVYCRYTHTENGGNVVFVTRSGGVETAVNTSVSPISTTASKAYEIVVNAAGTEASLYVDGVLVATSSTNVPTSASTGIGASIRKTAGTTSRELGLQSCAYEFVGSAPW